MREHYGLWKGYYTRSKQCAFHNRIETGKNDVFYGNPCAARVLSRLAQQNRELCSTIEEINRSGTIDS